LALDGYRILAVGDNAEVRKLAGPNTRIIDLGGRRVLPGFNDSHVHFLKGGSSLITVHLGTANSQAEFQERIAQFAKTLPKGAWLRNGLCDHQRWSPPNLPSHQLIDGISVDHSALLWRLDGHMALANTQAMKLAGVDRNTRDVPGGEIMRDKDGNPTGIFKDAAISLSFSALCLPSSEEMDHAM
jgi:predicted amidohydrolase YtcJ